MVNGRDKISNPVSTYAHVKGHLEPTHHGPKEEQLLSWSGPSVVK